MTTETHNTSFDVPPVSATTDTADERSGQPADRSSIEETADRHRANGESPLIRLRDLCKIYRVGSERVHALRDVSLNILPNEYVAIMGASGSGKSTLMNILGCLDVPSSGLYELCGEDVARLSQSRLAKIRGQQIGFVFQSFELLPRTSALRNVELPMSYSHTKHRRKRAMAALERVSLTDRASHHPNQLSGGQRQRVAIARALVQEPAIILADEPTGNLDSVTGEEIMAVFDDLHAEGQTIIIVTHEEEIAQRCRRVIRLHDGRVASDELVGARGTKGPKDQSRNKGTANGNRDIGSRPNA